jgi:hypothetical protein
MPRAKLKIVAPEINGILKRKTHSIHPWEVQHHPEHSEIEAYIEITGEWEIIAEIRSINHVAIADFIVALANQHNQKL